MKLFQLVLLLFLGCLLCANEAEAQLQAITHLTVTPTVSPIRASTLTELVFSFNSTGQRAYFEHDTLSVLLGSAAAGEQWYYATSNAVCRFGTSDTSPSGVMRAGRTPNMLDCTFVIDFSSDIATYLNAQNGDNASMTVVRCSGLISPRFATTSSIDVYVTRDSVSSAASPASTLSVQAQQPTLTVALGAGNEAGRMATAAPRVIFTLQNFYNPAHSSHALWGQGTQSPISASVVLTVPASAVSASLVSQCSAAAPYASVFSDVSKISGVVAAGLATLTFSVQVLSQTVGQTPVSAVITCPAGAVTLPTEAVASPTATYTFTAQPAGTPAGTSRTAAQATFSLPAVLPVRAADVALTLTAPLSVGFVAPLTFTFTTPVALTTRSTSTLRLRLGLPAEFSLEAELQVAAVCSHRVQNQAWQQLDRTALTTASGVLVYEGYLATAVTAWQTVEVRCTGASYPLAAFAAAPAGAYIEAVSGTVTDTVALARGTAAVPAIAARAAGTFGSTTATFTLTGGDTTNTTSSFSVVINPVSSAPASVTAGAPLYARLPSNMRPPVGPNQCTLAGSGSGGNWGPTRVTVSHLTDDTGRVSFAPEDGAAAIDVPANGAVTLVCTQVKLPENPRGRLRDVVWSLAALPPAAIIAPAIADAPNKLTAVPSYPGATTTLTAALALVTLAVNSGSHVAITMPVYPGTRGVFLHPSVTAPTCSVATLSGADAALSVVIERTGTETVTINRLVLTFGSTLAARTTVITCSGLSLGSGLTIGTAQYLPVTIYSTYPPPADGSGITEESWLRFMPVGARAPAQTQVSSLALSTQATGAASALVLRLSAFAFPLTQNHVFSLALPLAVSLPSVSAVECGIGLAAGATGEPTAAAVVTRVSLSTDTQAQTRTLEVGFVSGNVPAAPSSDRVYVLRCSGVQNPDEARSTPLTAAVSMYAIPGGARSLISSSTALLPDVLPAQLTAAVTPSLLLPGVLVSLTASIAAAPVPLAVGDVLTFTVPLATHAFTVVAHDPDSPLCTLNGEPVADAGAVPLVVRDAVAGELRLTLTVSTQELADLAPRAGALAFVCQGFRNPVDPATAGVAAVSWVSGGGARKAAAANAALPAIAFPQPGVARAAVQSFSARAGATAPLVLILSPLPVASPANTMVALDIPAGWALAPNATCRASIDEPDPARATLACSVRVKPTVLAAAAAADAAAAVAAAVAEGASSAGVFAAGAFTGLESGGTPLSLSVTLAATVPATTGMFRLFLQNLTAPASATAAATAAVSFVDPAGDRIMVNTAVPLPAVAAATGAVVVRELITTVVFAQAAPLFSFQLEAVANAFNLNAALRAAGVRVTVYSQTVVAGTSLAVAVLARSTRPWLYAEDVAVLVAAAAPAVVAAINATPLQLAAASLNAATFPAVVRALPATCSDGVRNGDESGSDCGGASSCGRCGFDARCDTASDCLVNACVGDAASGRAKCPWVGTRYTSAAAAAPAGLWAATAAIAAAIATAAALGA